MGWLESLVDVAGSIIIAGSTVCALIRFLGQVSSAAVAAETKRQLASNLVLEHACCRKLDSYY